MTLIKKYLKNIRTLMPINSKKEKNYLKEFKKHLDEYEDDNIQYNYDDLVEQFGEPKEIVMEYIQNADDDYLLNKMTIRTIIYRFIVFISIACLILAAWFGILWYQGYQDSKNSIISDIETTITEE